MSIPPRFSTCSRTQQTSTRSNHSPRPPLPPKFLVPTPTQSQATASEARRAYLARRQVRGVRHHAWLLSVLHGVVHGWHLVLSPRGRSLGRHARAPIRHAGRKLRAGVWHLRVSEPLLFHVVPRHNVHQEVEDVRLGDGCRNVVALRTPHTTPPQQVGDAGDTAGTDGKTFELFWSRRVSWRSVKIEVIARQCGL